MLGFMSEEKFLRFLVSLARQQTAHVIVPSPVISAPTWRENTQQCEPVVLTAHDRHKHWACLCGCETHGASKLNLLTVHRHETSRLWRETANGRLVCCQWPFWFVQRRRYWCCPAVFWCLCGLLWTFAWQLRPWRGFLRTSASHRLSRLQIYPQWRCRILLDHFSLLWIMRPVALVQEGKTWIKMWETVEFLPWRRYSLLSFDVQFCSTASCGQTHRSGVKHNSGFKSHKETFLTWVPDGVNTKTMNMKPTRRATMSVASAATHPKLLRHFQGEPWVLWPVLSTVTPISVSSAAAWCTLMMQTVIRTEEFGS